jgi:serine/threonine-protein kinase
MVPPNGSNTTTGATSDVVHAIRSSSILSERQLEKLEAKLAQGEYSPDSGALASSLVKEGLLTEYQARQILKGKSQGLVFGRYVILDFLGKGTMGKVYKAKHRMMGRVVALKILDSKYLSNPRSLARFQREMHLVGRLDHPNVIRAFDADRIEDCHFIAMEYAAGPTLQDLLQSRGALPPADVVYFAAQAAAGLAHAHAQGVLHRDIKPSNLLLTEGKKVKVLDFGLGTLLEKEELPAALTAAGVAVGTPDYISPEQARMVKIDGRSDLYSLGCSMYHLITGQLPFKGESSMDCIVGRISGKAIPISEVRPGLPQRLVQSIEKLMATNPEDRYQTADEAAAALRSLLRPKGAAPEPAAPTSVAVASVPVPAAVPRGNAVGVASVPVAVPTGAKKPVSPPPVKAAVPVSKPKSDTRRSRRKISTRKAIGVLAGVAVAGVSLIAGTIMFSRSSKNEPRASEEAALQTKSGPSVLAAPASTPKGPSSQAGGADAKKRQIVSSAAAEVARPRLVIENPKDGATVGTSEDLSGRIEGSGWPVIFVQADIPGQLWWCQAPVAKVDGGRFTSKVVFGDEFTPSGTRFRIVGIVTPTHQDALKFGTGSKTQDLPEGFPQSVVVVVTHR